MDLDLDDIERLPWIFPWEIERLVAEPTPEEWAALEIAMHVYGITDELTLRTKHLKAYCAWLLRESTQRIKEANGEIILARSSDDVAAATARRDTFERERDKVIENNRTMLAEGCRVGEFAAFGLVGGKKVAVPNQAWPGIRVDWNKAEASYADRNYFDLRFTPWRRSPDPLQRARIVRAMHAAGGAVPADLEIPHSDLSAKRSRASPEDAVTKWYRETWLIEQRTAGKRPSREADLRAAKEKFGDGVTEDFMRELRDKYAPAEWKRPGPRRGNSGEAI